MQYYVLDLESTGLERGIHEITEISIIRCEDLVQNTWHVKIKHPERASEKALEITKKSISYLLKTGKYLEEIANEVEAFINEDGLDAESRCFIAHNSSFDRTMIEQWWKSMNRIWPVNYWICTKEMGRKYIKKCHLDLINPYSFPSLRLENLLKISGIEYEDKFHGSAVDSRNTYELWQHFIKSGISNIEMIKKSPDIIKLAEATIKNNPPISDILDEAEKEEFYSFKDIED